MMTDPYDQTALPPPASSSPRPRKRLLLAAAGLLAVGAAAGGVVVEATRPAVTMAPATPVAIHSLTEGIVTIRGKVAETYGSAFIVADASGRALVEAGHGGEHAGLVTVGEAVTVQGRFDDGIVHAAFLVTPDGKVTALGPLHGPHHHGHGRPHGGPDDDDDRGPPPPPPGGPNGDRQPAAPAAPAAAPSAG